MVLLVDNLNGYAANLDKAYAHININNKENIPVNLKNRIVCISYA